MKDAEPLTCLMCGEHYPDEDALWWHECPEWRKEIKRIRPRLAVYQNVEQFYETEAKRRPDHWAVRWIAWGMRQVFPHDEDATLADVLAKLGPDYAGRLERRMVRRGLVPDPHRSDIEKVRIQMDIEVHETRSRRRRRRWRR